MDRHKILIVDDEPYVLEALERILSKDYKIFLDPSGKKGLKTLSKHPDISVIICDQRMAEMTGVEMLEKSLSLSPYTIRILLTGYTDIEAAIAAINQGQIYRYLTKPWEPEYLKLEIKKACEYFDLHQTIRIQNEKLKELDKAKDYFLMLIAHELKTPLTTILSFTESLLSNMTQTKEEKEQFLRRIEGGAQKLNSLIEDTLDLMTVKTGKLKLNKTSFSIKSAIQETIEDLHEKALQKKILIESGFIDSFQLKADYVLFKKALYEILDYAIDCEDEKGKISIAVQKQKKKIKCSIFHRGHELTSKQKTHLFEPFMVSEDILTHKMGAGLALPISKAIIEAHEGSIDIESSPEHGTAFHLTFPI